MTVGFAGLSGAFADTTSCPVTGAGPWQACVDVPASAASQVGQEITTGAQNPGTPWLITDKYGAPMAWVNLYGLYSGGDGGAHPGGLVCVTNGVRQTVACLTPYGNLVLARPTAPGVAQVTETLTPADIAFLHSLEAAARARG